MALSANKEWFWGRTGVYYVTSASDIPTFDAGQAFNPGDLLININPINNVPAIWQCTTSGSLNQNPVFVPIAFTGGGTERVTAAPTTIVPTDVNLVITSAGNVTVPAVATIPAGTPIAVIDASSGSVTITPTTGTISGLAAVTLAAGGTASIINLGGTLYTT